MSEHNRKGKLKEEKLLQKLNRKITSRTMTGSRCRALQFVCLLPLGFGKLKENKAITGSLLKHTVRHDKSLCVGVPKIRVSCEKGDFSDSKAHFQCNSTF